MEILMLGTSSMVPTKDRNHSATLIYHEKDSLLFDCGEGTQRQMKIAGVDINRIARIFITHWHGDHVLGLPGLVQTMCGQAYDKTLHIYGPKGTKRHFSYMLKAFEFDLRFEIQIHEATKGIIYKSDEYNVECLPMKHSVPTIGFALVENPKRKMNLEFMRKMNIPKGHLWSRLQNGQDAVFDGKKITSKEATVLIPGKKVAYIVDTGYCTNAVKLAENADLLIIEATYISEKEEKAEAYEHLTAKQAALIANNANAKKLLLTHFSQRYKTTHDIEEEAKTYFANTTCAYDFMKVRV
jgi:ribonuclease Z